MEPSPSAGKAPSMGPRKQANYIGDLLHWAEMSGVAISRDAAQLIKSDTQPALRAALAAMEADGFHGFHHAAYRARWGEARDLSQREVLVELLEQAGLDAASILERAESSEVGERLDANTEGAIERGVFGVPTVFVGDDMFWGNDRFEVARFYIERAQP